MYQLCIYTLSIPSIKLHRKTIPIIKTKPATRFNKEIRISLSKMTLLAMDCV